VLARLWPSLRDDGLPASFSSALTTPWPVLHDTSLLVIFSHLLTFTHWQGSGRAFVMIFPPPSLSSSALVKLWLSLRNTLSPLRPDHVHVSFSVQVRPWSSLTMIVSWTWNWNWYGAVYKRCTCMSDLRSQKRPLHLLCTLYPNAMVPIQFEPELEGHQPVPHMSHPLQDRYIGACGAVYLPQALYLHARCSIVVKSRSSVLLAPCGCWRAGCCLRRYILASPPPAVQLWLTRVWLTHLGLSAACRLALADKGLAHTSWPLCRPPSSSG
jgi:hypothetical protein